MSLCHVGIYKSIFHTSKAKKEVIKAQYSAAEAQVRIKENVTGISEEMTDVGMAMSRAEDKTEKMKAKAQALDEMIDSGVLTDYTLTSSTTGSDNDIEGELQKMTVKSSVEEELAKLKAANAKKKKNQPEGQEEQNKEESRVEEEEQPVVAE